jgi:hypothetical protein
MTPEHPAQKAGAAVQHSQRKHSICCPRSQSTTELAKRLMRVWQRRVCHNSVSKGGMGQRAKGVRLGQREGRRKTSSRGPTAQQCSKVLQPNREQSREREGVVSHFCLCREGTRTRLAAHLRETAPTPSPSPFGSTGGPPPQTVIGNFFALSNLGQESTTRASRHATTTKSNVCCEYTQA